MAKRVTTLLRAPLQIISKAVYIHNIAESRSGRYLCTSGRRPSAGDAARLSSASACVSMHNCYASGSSEGGIGGKNSYSTKVKKRAEKGLSLDLSARLPAVQCLLCPILVCSCIAAAQVMADAHSAARDPFFPVSLPTIRSEASVSSALPPSLSASGRALTFHLPQDVTPTNGRGTPTHPAHVHRGISAASEDLSNSEFERRRTDIPSGRSNSYSTKGKVARLPPPSPSAADGVPSDTSCPICFVMGLLLSVTGTLISAIGDICIRYSFVRQEANFASAVAGSIAEAADREASGASARAGMRSTFSVEDTREFRASSENDPGVDSHSHRCFTTSQPPVTVAPREYMWQGGTDSTSVSSCEHYCLPWKPENFLQQAGSSISHGPQQRLYCPSTSAVATPLLPGYWFSPELLDNIETSTWTEHVERCVAGATCKPTADTAATSTSLDSTHASPLSTGSSVNSGTLDHVSRRSEGTWSSPTAPPGTEPWRKTERHCQAPTLCGTPSSLTEAVAAAHGGSGASAASQGADAVHANSSMFRPAIAGVGTEKSSCKHLRWDGLWVLGISCTCVVSPLLSIISLSLLPANVTGFAALQILFVVLLARCFLGEPVHRVNLGGGILVIAGLITLTWSTKSISALPDRTTLYKQLTSPPAIVFEICCGCIILSGLLLLFFLPKLEQEKSEDEIVAVQEFTGAAVEEEAVTETLLIAESEARYTVLSSQREQQQRQQHQSAHAAGELSSQGRLSAMDEMYARASTSRHGLHFQQMGAAKVKQLAPPPGSSEKFAWCRRLGQSPDVRRIDKSQIETATCSAATTNKTRTTENEAGQLLQSNRGWVTSLSIADSAENVGERSNPSVHPGTQWTSWYLCILSQSKDIFLPMAAGVSGSIASICLKLVQAFVVSFSEACYDAYNNRSLRASPTATTVMVSSSISPVSVSLPGMFFPEIFTPLAGSFLASGSSSGAQLPGLLRIPLAPDTPSPSAAPSALSISAAATTPAAQPTAPQPTSEETESVSHLLLCLISPTFLASHLQLPLLLVAAGTAALVELFFLSHTLKNQPASEGVPLMNAALTVSMGLGGLTLLGAAPESAVGWGLGLGLVVVGVGILGFGGKTWLVARRFVLHVVDVVAGAGNVPSQITTRCIASVNHRAVVSNDEFRSDVLADGGSVKRSAEDTLVACRSGIGESSATTTATVEVGRMGPMTLEAEDAEDMLRARLELAATKSATWKTDTPAVGTASRAAWLSKAVRTSRSITSVGETGGTTVDDAPRPGNSAQHTTGQEPSPCVPSIGILSHICEPHGTAGPDDRKRKQELRSPLLLHPE